ncbi:hypothetical protein [Thiothrix nivea]|uniref:Uncharacterized protein n=1 Tax=Thiothrix nivea (strain ATCC 35100 / DSM 5205 / JP2) TaxID=870187 RepID=A0A656HKY7_THINJ|nr:hypothetical protein [Thiothrix nivea]EIJ36953.1 hypothetical protein Thini_4478 [Thiothrix nivea DSM 5205]
MKNPWSQLPITAPRILADDKKIIDQFNKHYCGDLDFSIQTQLFPEPFIGDPNSPLYVLGLNPGYSPLADDKWHSDAEFTEAITNNINHRPTSFPFYFLNPKFENAPGSAWWLMRSRWLRGEVGNEFLAQSMFCVELFPYHSHKYKSIPKSISSSSLVPSSNYSVFLVQQAILANKTIIAMRALKQWFKLIPQLKTYGKLHRLNSPQNVSLSPNNIAGYSALVDELITAKEQRIQTEILTTSENT